MSATTVPLSPPSSRPIAKAAFALIVLNALVFGQTLQFEFVYFDDRLYVTENPYVLNGLTVEGLRYAFSTEPAPMSNPLTLVSHMLDVELFGVNPGAHHAVNVVFHAANSILLFVILLKASGSYWCSLLVAAIFAVHPLHAENVAWVSGRKDLLSTFFWFLALYAYLGYVRSRSMWRMAGVSGLYALSLLAKPMGVTFPFVLLLLDAWPLKRLELTWQSIRARLDLIWEKAPLFALTLLGSYGAWYLQHAGGATADLDVPFSSKLANAIASYGVYVHQFTLPINLSVFYPFRDPVPILSVGAGALILAVGTAAAIRYRQSMPWIFVGWFLYVGMLVPVIGVVQIGSQAHADRYMYLPIIGLSIAVVWTAARVVERSGSAQYRKWAAAGVAGIVAIWTALGFSQTSYWSNSESLFHQSIAATEPNGILELNLGAYYFDQGRRELAEEHIRRAAELDPTNPKCFYNLALLDLQDGDSESAEDSLRKAIELNSEYQPAHEVLTHILLQTGRFEEAIVIARRIQAFAPQSGRGFALEGMAMAQQGRGPEALVRLRQGVNANPQDHWVRLRLADQLLFMGDAKAAAVEYRVALQQGADGIEDWYKAALAFEAITDVETAVRLHRQILARAPNFTPASERLAALSGR